MGPVETYLSEMRELRSARAGVKETTYYTALANLLDEVGKTLKPRVRCILQLQNRGAGNPDGGLFTADQFPKGSGEPAGAGIPSRGVIEIKSTSEDAWVTADGEQVSKYWGLYKQVLVTNYRDFVLVGRDPEGCQIKLETYRLARNEAEFWSDAHNPGKKSAVIGQSFIEFLKRALLLAAPLDSASDLAWFLASYAHEAKFRIEHGEYPSLATVRTALEEALGMTFEGAKGDHFFRSTLVQTLFYGMFSAWVLWSKSHPSRTARFNWRLSDQHLRVPILRKLFREVADPGSMESMDLNEVLDWAAATLNRVERGPFFETFEERHAVQYFYEPFLEAFDPELRKDLGVWYTPIEIVDYMVERVDRVLREELALPDGLADPNVYVLDPCCGTGAYLVSVLNRIAETLRQKGGDALLAQDLKEAAIKRVFGFEILPAPFVVAHLQLGLLMQHLGVPFADKGKKERASVFLTNSLTGWEPSVNPKKQLSFLELEEERDAADVVKREKPILVILGNPPYNSFAGIARIEEERGLSDAYRVANNAPAPQGQGLNDLYVRFFRMAERRIVEKTRAGVVCFISNYSWLDGLSFTAMRERYLEVFDRIWIDNLNGDKYKTGKLTPDGKPDPSVFFTTHVLCCRHMVERGANLFPIFLTSGPTLLAAGERTPNLSPAAGVYLRAIGGSIDNVFHHAVAILHSARYAVRNSSSLQMDWPRIPLPASAAALQTSAALGHQVAALLDIEKAVPGVTVSPVRPELRVIGVLTAAAGPLNPDDGDLDLTAGWGHGGKGGVTMPGKGQAVERPYTPTELAAFAESGTDPAASLGETTYDVYLNGKAFWSNIPSAVWEYTLGGYQVIKKWLSYREKKLLDRGLTNKEARHVTAMAQRIAALLLMGPALDANYDAIKGDTYIWHPRTVGDRAHDRDQR